MDPLVQYRLPVKGMGEGTHQFSFLIDEAFFGNFEDSPVKSGRIEVVLELDKRPGLYSLDFRFSGTINTECDRCLSGIDLPVSGQQQLLVKLSEEEKGEEAEVVFLHPEEPHLNVARFIYEFIVLGIPMIKVYDCEEVDPRPCNLQMLTYLEAKKKREDETNPLWEELKKLNIKQN